MAERVKYKEYEVIKDENKALREEIEALKGQIDSFSRKSKSLQRENTEMHKQINQFELTKNELEELQKQKDELFAVIIHDIKNPVSLIKQLVDLLGSYDMNAGERQEVIDDISATTSRIVNLSIEISKILSYELYNFSLNIQEVNVKFILDDVFRRFTLPAKNKNINIRLQAQENLPKIECDPLKIDEILDNLVSNAVKFTQKGGMVIIHAKSQNQKVVISIEDNGHGLSENEIANAFKIGGVLSAKPTGDETSTGFGLWIAKKFITAHKGRIWIESELGKGSIFHFELPIKQNGS